MTKSWREVLPVHPAADLFPMMSETELKELGEDIRKNGLRSPISLFVAADETISLLDGRNRLDAMELAGLPTIVGGKLSAGGAPGPLYYLAYKHDPYALVLSFNIHRRHLTTEQRIELVEKLVKATPEKSDRQIAEQTKTSPTTVGKVRKKLERAGKVSTMDTRTDKKGVKQPAAKKRAPDDIKVGAANLKSVFLMNCAGAVQAAEQEYTANTPITEEIAAEAERVAGVWTMLAAHLRSKLVAP